MMARAGLIILYVVLGVAGLALAGLAIFGEFDQPPKSALMLVVIVIVGINFRVMRKLGWIRPPEPKRPRRPGEFAD